MKIIPKKMLLALALLVILAGCKKQIEDSVKNLPLANVGAKGLQIALTSTEQAKLAEIIKAGGIKDSADFVAKVNEIKLQNVRSKSLLSSTNSTNSESEGYFEGVEEENFASFYIPPVYELNEYDYASVVGAFPESQGIPLRGFKGVGTENKRRFAIRGNNIMFTIPFVAVVKMGMGNPTITKINAQLGAPPFMSPSGPYWGEYTSNP